MRLLTSAIRNVSKRHPLSPTRASVASIARTTNTKIDHKRQGSKSTSHHDNAHKSKTLLSDHEGSAKQGKQATIDRRLDITDQDVKTSRSEPRSKTILADLILGSSGRGTPPSRAWSNTPLSNEIRRAHYRMRPVVPNNEYLEIKYTCAILFSCADSVMAYPLNPVLPSLLLRHKQRYEYGFQLLLSTSSKKKLSMKSIIRTKIRTRVRQAFMDVVKEDGITLGWNDVGGNHRSDNAHAKTRHPQRITGTLQLIPTFEALHVPMDTLHRYIRIAFNRIPSCPRDVNAEQKMKPHEIIKAYDEQREKYIKGVLSDETLDITEAFPLLSGRDT